MAPSQRSGPAASRRSNACGIVLAQRGHHARHHLVGAEPGRVHAQVSLTVIRLAAAIELLDLGGGAARQHRPRSEEHTSELQSLTNLVCRLLLEKKKTTPQINY